MLNCSDRTRLLSKDATKLSPGERCDLVFLDPPYGQGLGELALKSAISKGWIMAGTMVIFEESKKIVPNGFQLTDSRKFGGTTITFLTAL